MTKAAEEAVDRVFRPGFKYSKAEALLVSLCQKGEYTDDLFSISQPVATEKVMGVLDSINERWGRGTLRLARVPTNPDWGMRPHMMSQSLRVALTSFGLCTAGKRPRPRSSVCLSRWPLNKFFETVKDSWGLGRI